MIDNQHSAYQLLGEQGPLSSKHEFIPRRGQQEMAILIESAIDARLHCVIEAASGAGKTFAYLTPLLTRCQSDKSFKAIISTATHYLQQQLFQRDLPDLQAAFSSRVSVCVLRGRQHYLCPYYIEKSLASSRISQTVRDKLLSLNARFRQTGFGELNKMDSDLSAYVSCSSNDCLSRQCPYYDVCPFYLSRSKAEKAQLVIVNHHLLFSSMEIDSALIENAYCVVVDEAHRLADVGQGLSGDWISSRELHYFIKQTIEVINNGLQDQSPVIAFLEKAEAGLNNLADKLPSISNYQPSEHQHLITQVRDTLATLDSWFALHKARHSDLDALAAILDNLYQCCNRIVEAEGLSWIQKQGRGFVMRQIPAELSTSLRTHLDTTNQSWIFTSATLTIAKEADTFLKLIGLDKSHFHSIDSDISYLNRAKLYLPTINVDPNDEAYIPILVSYLTEALDQTQGRALLLFSSYRALTACAELLVDQRREYFVQRADTDHYQMIKGFTSSENAVLMGTGSFWEGLDLSGAKIALLMIDKLPFSAPDEPVVKLRSQYLSRMGVDSFHEYILPEAVIRFRQGCGRLLRRLSDRGVIMLPDPRLSTRDYGSVFLDSLPRMERVAGPNEIAEFLSPNQSEEASYD